MPPFISIDSNNNATLMVQGKPFLVLGGEVHNSSASSLEYMAEKVWPNVAKLNINTLLVPVYWELIEPSEGHFDFSILDGLLHQAREHDTHLILLWFGLWKNAESSYVPQWVKQDTKRFWRVITSAGTPSNCISPFCAEAIAADANAFSRLMHHIRTMDSDDSTVLMMQVENEVGVLGTDRDRSDTANQLFMSQIPEALHAIADAGTNWDQAFGERSAEAFMAHAFASAVEQITHAGQQQYPLPCYTNAWLRQYPWYPGSYPVGGPVESVHDIWFATAPSLTALAPDIYLPNAPSVMKRFQSAGRPLLIPEARQDVSTVSSALYAYGIGSLLYSPFGIEDLEEHGDCQPASSELLESLNIDREAFNTTNTSYCLSQLNDLLSESFPAIRQYRDHHRITAFIQRDIDDRGHLIHISGMDVLLRFQRIQQSPLSSGLILDDGDGELYCLAMNCSISVGDCSMGCMNNMIEHIEEGKFVSGQWVKRRVLNGDEGAVAVFDDVPSWRRIHVSENRKKD
ncbi:DUF5597 domain-containing protein [Bifidobacterium olomucense]|uniref:Beta-galactosidase n=1 Tax=Bifidobacterium olomucense TaxID=2675324 RepID=A0A7Y0EX64_9BIFI|nr:DUF5597 domain-containing protein [Bifidobacterium sp. DSM 109959]NMM98063.1 beta-galactosidase [Bifidobacterium sp. DSM 109959]